MIPEVQLALHQCEKFSADPKLTHNQAVKWVIKYLKGTKTERNIIKPRIKNSIELVVEVSFARVCNQAEGTDPGFWLHRYV